MREYNEIYSLEGRTLETGWKVLHKIEPKSNRQKGKYSVCYMVEKARLTRLANQFSQYIYAKGGLISDSERAYARKLLDMISSVDAEGSKVMDDQIIWFCESCESDFDR
jgi:hypothetical protein